MNYADDIAVIGNGDARLAELLFQAAKPQQTHLLFEALWDTYPPLRHRAAEELAAVMSDELAVTVAQIAAGVKVDAELPAAVTLDVRRAATLALRTEQLPHRAEQLLLRACTDEDDSIRYHALLALHRNATDEVLRGATEDGLKDLDSGVAVIAAQIVAERGWRDLVPQVVELLDRLTGTDRFAVAAAITEVLDKPEDAPATLVDVLLDGLRSPKTLAAACKALARLQAKRAVAPLQRVMSSLTAHPLNKVEAAAALVALDEPEGARYLEKMLDGRRKDAQGYAIELIASLNLDQYRARVEAIARSTDYHADTAVVALAKFGDTRALELLGDIARTHPDPAIRTLAAHTAAADGTVNFAEPA